MRESGWEGIYRGWHGNGKMRCDKTRMESIETKGCVSFPFIFLWLEALMWIFLYSASKSIMLSTKRAAIMHQSHMQGLKA